MRPLYPELSSKPVPQPPLGPRTIERFCDLLTRYLEEARAQYIYFAHPLEREMQEALAPFFHKEILEHSLFAPAHPHLKNPDFYPELRRMGIKGLIDLRMVTAIAFKDIVVYQEKITLRSIFHELVHLEQYRQLGAHNFIHQYVQGFFAGGCYEAIPLETQAFDLDTRFHNAPLEFFKVEDEVGRLAHQHQT